jgi:ABC-type branched-subunit amino acid transport system ATPase component
MSTTLKDILGGFYSTPRGTVRIESTQIKWFSEQSDRRLDLVRGGHRHLRTKLGVGGSSGLSPLKSDGSHDGQA